MVNDCAIRLGYPVRRVLGQRFSFQFPNGSRITAVPHNADTSAGRTATVLIVDEASRVADKVYFPVSAFVSRSHGEIWLLSTPNHQYGFFHNFWHNDDPDWVRIFSNVDDCPELDPKYLAMHRAVDPTGYARDFECRFVADNNSLTNLEFISAMKYSPEEERTRLRQFGKN
jgi:hypothetical protein